jgi:hypothetical protein
MGEDHAPGTMPSQPVSQSSWHPPPPVDSPMSLSRLFPRR